MQIFKASMILLTINWSQVGLQAGQLLLALSILIILHEFGHYITARWFKCRVEKFFLFFDPWFAIAKRKIGDTVYGIGWLPLGGYVKIAGMIDESMDKEQMKQPPKEWEFRSKPAWQRLIIMLGGIIMNVLVAFVIYAFLHNRIGFLDITDVIEKTMEKVSFISQPTLDEYFETDGAARHYAADLMRL